MSVLIVNYNKINNKYNRVYNILKQYMILPYYNILQYNTVWDIRHEVKCSMIAYCNMTVWQSATWKQKQRTTMCICTINTTCFSPRLAISRAASFPMPALAPVIRTVFPSNMTLLRHTPPASHLRKASMNDPDRKWKNTVNYIY